jgi:hypothetical protein
VDGPLPDGAGLASRHATPVAGEGLRSDGQVVPSWAAAALMLPSRSARAKARSGLGAVHQEAAGLPAYPRYRVGQGPTGRRRR